jgi:hypothetical protein
MEATTDERTEIAADQKEFHGLSEKAYARAIPATPQGCAAWAKLIEPPSDLLQAIQCANPVAKLNAENSHGREIPSGNTGD